MLPDRAAQQEDTAHLQSTNVSLKVRLILECTNLVQSSIHAVSFVFLQTTRQPSGLHYVDTGSLPPSVSDRRTGPFSSSPPCTLSTILTTSLLHTLPDRKEAGPTEEGSTKSPRQSQREFLRNPAIHHSPRLAGLHQYTGVGRLEDLPKPGQAEPLIPPKEGEREEVVDEQANEVVQAPSGKNQWIAGY